MSGQKIVDSNLYDKNYYYHDNEGWHEYAQGLDVASTRKQARLRDCRSSVGR